MGSTTLYNIATTILGQLCCCWYNLGWNKLMSVVFLIMKECFVVFDFELQKYLPINKNDKNFGRSLVILFFMAFAGL
jgi:hypothetical protein